MTPGQEFRYGLATGRMYAPANSIEWYAGFWAGWWLGTAECLARLWLPRS